jgi:hypothetical protein
MDHNDDDEEDANNKLVRHTTDVVSPYWKERMAICRPHGSVLHFPSPNHRSVHKFSAL